MDATGYAIEDGMVWWFDAGRRNRVPTCIEGEEMAVVVETRHGYLQKRGPAEAVRRWYDGHVSTTAAFDPQGAEDMKLIAFPAIQASLDAVNALVAPRGRITVDAFLQRLGGIVPDEDEARRIEYGAFRP